MSALASATAIGTASSSLMAVAAAATAAATTTAATTAAMATVLLSARSLAPFAYSFARGLRSSCRVERARDAFCGRERLPRQRQERASGKRRVNERTSRRAGGRASERIAVLSSRRSRRLMLQQRQRRTDDPTTGARARVAMARALALVNCQAASARVDDKSCRSLSLRQQQQPQRNV